MDLVYFITALLAFWPLSVCSQATASTAYTPKGGNCPPGFSLVRRAGPLSKQRLSESELTYLRSRKSRVLPAAWKSYLANVQRSKVTLPHYVSTILKGKSRTIPNLAIATSGGGYRAAIFGAGVLNALDGRNSTSVSTGTGGLLQSATYISALSGGSWLLTSLIQANFPLFQELIFGSSSNGGYAGWLAQFGVVAPTPNSTINQEYIAGLIAEIKGKHDAGFPVTLADVWARGLARHFVNGTNATKFFDASTHGAGITFSQLANLPSFTSHSIPFPLMVADSISSSENASNIITDQIVPFSNPIYEFSIYEMGSYDPILSAFTPTKYLGTTNSTLCVTGYDQAAFITSTSSGLLNEFNVSAAALLESIVGPVVEFLNASIPQPGVELDVVRYPNPFFGVANGTFMDTSQTVLSLVDGGEDGELIPIQPLLVKARDVDVIIAIDASGNATGWADGSSMIATKNRTTLFPSAYSFPPLPSTVASFASANLTIHPTFFGCYTATTAPLIIYIANGGPPRDLAGPPLTNTTTLQLTYEQADIQAILDQTWAIATQGKSGSSSADTMWPACLACAVVDRARHRSKLTREGICASCFERYCWTEDSKYGNE